MKHRAQYGIIVVSAGLLVVSGLLAYGIVDSFMQANIFEAGELHLPQSIRTPIAYETQINRGDELLSRGYTQLAVEAYKEASQEDPNHPEAFQKMGQSHMQLKNYAEAQNAFAKAHERSNSDLDAWNYANALLQNGEFTLAASLTETMSENSQERLFLESLIALVNEDFQSAKAKLKQSAEAQGKISPSSIAKLQTQFENFKLKQGAQDAYLKATLVKALIDIEQYRLAEHMSLQVLELASDYRDVWSMLGYAKLQLMEFSGAEDAFKQAQNLDPVKPEIHYFLGTAHFEQEEFEAAGKAFELALLYGFQPESEVYKKLAESQIQTNQFEDALATYEFLIEIEPTNVELFVRPLWIATEVVQDLDRALKLAKSAQNNFPEDAISHVLMASVRLEQGELAKAEENINTALELDPNSAEAHYNAGLIQEAKGNPEGAKWEYQKAHELATANDQIAKKASERYNALISPNPDQQ